jgi:hypothetical protein
MKADIKVEPLVDTTVELLADMKGILTVDW